MAAQRRGIPQPRGGQIDNDTAEKRARKREEPERPQRQRGRGKGKRIKADAIEELKHSTPSSTLRTTAHSAERHGEGFGKEKTF